MSGLGELPYHVASFISALFVLEYGADKFLDHTAIVAKRLNVSPTLVGLLTCGAEWEELVVIAVAIGQKQPTLALGNLMGSSIANILASFSLGILFMNTATFDRSSKIYAAVLLGVTSIFVLALLAVPPALKWLAGLGLMVAFVAYIGSVASMIYRGSLVAPEDSDSDSDCESSSSSTSDSDSDSDAGNAYKKPLGSNKIRHRHSLSGVSLTSMMNGKTSDSRSKLAPGGFKKHPKSLLHHIIKLSLGLAALLISGYVIANSAADIGYSLGMSGTVVGTTILSLATTIPEKMIAVLGGMRKQSGILVANTVGSNIFLLTLCGGVLFFWGDAEQIQTSFTLFEVLTMWLASAAIFTVIMTGSKWWMGVVSLACYIVFLGVEFACDRNLGDD